jgi:hypothetical protein
MAQTPETIRSIARDFTKEFLDELDPLDEEFMGYPHDLTDLLLAYESKKPEEFGTLPEPDDA